jgi:hypothetical protein
MDKQKGALSDIEQFVVLAIVTLVLLFIFPFRTMPRFDSLFSYTTRFTICYLASLGFLTIFALECVRRSRRTRAVFVICWFALIIGAIYAKTYPIKTVTGSLISLEKQVYSSFQSFGLVTFLVFYTIRSWRYIKSPHPAP